MKLARIVHTQCSETRGFSHVWIPDNMQRDKFREIVSKCNREHIKSCIDYKTNCDPPNDYLPYGPKYANYPDKTVREINEEYAKKKSEWEAWNKRVKYDKPFSERLREEGIISIYEYEPDYEAYADWGHNHGVNLKYQSEEENQDANSPDNKHNGQIDW